MYRLLTLLLACVTLVGAQPATAGNGGETAPVVTLVLASEAEVAGTAIRLGDIASVHAEDAYLASQVAETSLGYAPAPGYSRLLVNHQIGMELQRAFPRVAWVFKGERATRVWPRTERITAQEIQSAAAMQLEIAAAGRDVEFELASPLADVLIPFVEEGATLRVEPQEARLATGRLSVPVLIDVQGEPFRRVNTVWSVRLYQSLPVPIRSIVAGEVLTDSLFETRRVLLDRRTAGTPLPVASLRGATAARNLGPEHPVTDQDIHRPVVVRSGEGLMVEVSKGAVSARVVGIAVGSGAVGDRIPVRLRDSGREMLARVVSAELARVELGR